MKLNLLKKVFWFFYLVNDDGCDLRSGSFSLAIGGTGAVIFSHVLFIVEILKIIYGINPYISLKLVFGVMIIIYTGLVIYFFLFKNYKILDEIRHLSPWKKPIIWGGIYSILSWLSLLIIPFIRTVS